MQFKNLFTVGIATALTRVLGFVRDMLIASTLGTGVIADAFILAFRLPNLARRVFAEGAFNAGFIPLYERIKKRRGNKQALLFTGEIIVCFMSVVVLLSLIAILFLPWLFPIFVHHASDPALTLLLTRLAFPFLIFSTLAAIYAALLNAKERFSMAAFAPLLLNIMLVAVLLLSPAPIGVWLAVTVSVAGALQALMLYGALKRVGLSPLYRKPFMTPRVKKAFFLAIPGLIAGGLSQLNVLVGTLIATTATAAVSHLYYADRLYQLPLSVVATALGVVLLKDMMTSKDKTESHNRALEVALGLGIPAACGLYFASDAIIALLFQRGAFSAQDTLETAKALKAYAWGLPFFVMIKASSNVFFANNDTKTPMMIGLVGLFCNALLAVYLMGHFGAAGVAHATSSAGVITAMLMLFWLSFKPDRLFFMRILQIIFAAILMSLLIYFINLSIFLTIPLSIFIYVGLLALFNLAEVKKAWHKLVYG
jgi:putative peptidoglycan lipid II flippase